MKYKEIKDIAKPELQKMLGEERKQLLELKLNNVLGRLENPIKIRLKRKSIARILTALAEKG